MILPFHARRSRKTNDAVDICAYRECIECSRLKMKSHEMPPNRPAIYINVRTKHGYGTQLPKSISSSADVWNIFHGIIWIHFMLEKIYWTVCIITYNDRNSFFRWACVREAGSFLSILAHRMLYVVSHMTTAIHVVQWVGRRYYVQRTHIWLWDMRPNRSEIIHSTERVGNSPISFRTRQRLQNIRSIHPILPWTESKTNEPNSIAQKFKSGEEDADEST